MNEQRIQASAQGKALSSPEEIFPEKMIQRKVQLGESLENNNI